MLLLNHDETKVMGQFQQWISVEDRLPDPWECVLVSTASSSIVETASHIPELGDKWCDSECRVVGGVTHWMPLPKPPQ